MKRRDGCTNYMQTVRATVLIIEPCHEKPVFRVCDQGRLKPDCTVRKTRYKGGISDIETRVIILSRQQTTKALIRLSRCPGWSAPLLFAYGINRFPHDVAHLVYRFFRLIIMYNIQGMLLNLTFALASVASPSTKLLFFKYLWWPNG